MRTQIISALALILTLSACEREDKQFMGPALTDIFGDFSVLEEFDISDRQVDFANGESTTFTALFSKQVDWEVRIEGLESGAIKSISGFSSILDASTSAVWNGTTTELPLFKVEECAVELRVPSDSLVVHDTITVTSVRDISGITIADFENGMQSGWNVFAQSGANMSFAIRDDIPAAQGDKYYDMGGEVSWDYLIGLIDFPASAYPDGTFGLSPDPSAVYFNVMLYIPEGITNEIVLFRFNEDENEDGLWSDSSEDQWALELTGLDQGWQQVSIRYSDMVTLINGQPAAPFGNGLYEPNKLHTISVLFLANPATGYSQTLMDYLIFTEGGPLVP